MTSPYRDLERPPLSERALRKALVVPDGLWSRLDVVPETGSTNADVVAAATEGAPHGVVLIAEHQVAGRGRLDRTWSAPPRSALTFSVLLRPPPETRASWGWLPLLAGLAVAAPLARLGEVDARLKWPNDVLIGERKVAGLLAEVTGDAVVVGIGINVSLHADELPVPAATSLHLEEASVVDREPVLRAVLRDLARRYVAWSAPSGDATQSGLLDEYRELSATIGQQVEVQLPGGVTRRGRAVDVDASGRLLVADADGVDALAAGDVVHLR